MYKNMDSFNIAIFVPNLHGGKRRQKIDLVMDNQSMRRPPGKNKK
jgi:hypothetical protein